MPNNFSYIARSGEHAQDLTDFREAMHKAIVQLIGSYRQDHPGEAIYGFALSAGQCGNYIGCRLITEERLRRIAEEYYNNGYRAKEVPQMLHGLFTEDYRGGTYNLEDLEVQLDVIAAWMRWQNPEDDWDEVEFEDSFFEAFQQLVYEKKAFGEDAEQLAEFCCDDVLATLHDHEEWVKDPALHSIVLSVISDEADFFTCAARANPYSTAYRYWDEMFTFERLDVEEI